MAKKKPTTLKPEKNPAGMKLLRTIRGHTGRIFGIAFSPDGKKIASGSHDETIKIWDADTGKNRATLNGHKGPVYSVCFNPDGKKIASGSFDGTVNIWDADTGKNRINISHNNIWSVCFSPDGKKIASGSFNKTIQTWDAETGKNRATFDGHLGSVYSICFSTDGKKIFSGSGDNTIKIWDVESGKNMATLKGHKGDVNLVSISKDGKKIVSGSNDQSIRIWDIQTEKLLHILEGHTHTVRSCLFIANDQLLASHSLDDTIRLWRTDTWQTIAILSEKTAKGEPAKMAIHPTKPILAIPSENDTVIKLWELDYGILLGRDILSDSVLYTTAKIALVGDSGVGKTGLGWRLANGSFKEHKSTHGQQFWVIDELGKKRSDGTECEAVLWDFAGQPDYRLVHSLFLNDVDTALVLFDPTNRKELLSGVDFWLNQLIKKEQELCNSILVGARIDRGTSTMTDSELQVYCKRFGIKGGYVSTSASSGEGVAELIERIKEQIPWEEMTTTVTTQTFKRIKDYVLGLKEQADRTQVLVHPDELRKQLQTTDIEWDFSDSEMMTAVGHLANLGYVTILKGSEGRQSILLAPDLLANLASSIVLEARRNPRGLGVLDESRLLKSDYPFPELNDLQQDEGEILLDASTLLFLENNLCFRETFNEQTFLVFPSLINEKRPIEEDITPIEGASYRVKGAIETVYASLVVLLGYTNTFIRTHQWQNQAQYELGKEEICGFQQTENREGEIELVLYYGEKTPEPIQLMFRGMFERFLSRRELEIARYQPVICGKCSTGLDRNVIMNQLKKGKDFSFCHECGEKLNLPNPEPLTRLSNEQEKKLDKEQSIVKHRTAFESALVRVKGLLRSRGKEKKPTCFISYAWGVLAHERWVLQLAKDLRNAEIDVIFDQWHSKPGMVLSRFIEQIDSSDYVFVVGTPKLQEKYKSEKTDPVVSAELNLINYRIMQPSEYGPTVLPILLDGNNKTSFSPQLQSLVNVDFREEEFYFLKLFNTIWQLHNLSSENPLLEELRASMSPNKKG